MTTRPNESTNRHTLRAAPEGYHTVTPWIISRNTAGVIEFAQCAFGAVEIARRAGEQEWIERMAYVQGSVTIPPSPLA